MDVVIYITDHQGNIRAVTDATGMVEQANDYRPFGSEFDAAATGTNPGLDRRYGGKEKDATLPSSPFYDFEARMYNPVYARFTTMDPMAEKYYSISPYAYCANDPVNLVDPSGMTNWRAIKKGVLTMAAGIGSFAGGVALSAGTGGVASSFGVVLIFDGVSGIGLGLGQILIGAVADSSEETTIAAESLPSDMTSTLFKSSDIIAGNDNGEIEKIGNGLKIVLGASATQAVAGSAGILSRIGTGAQLVDYLSTMPPTASTPEKTENDMKENDIKNLNSNALLESRVDW